MSRPNPFLPVRDATSLILRCRSEAEIEHLKTQLMEDINHYTLPDQGFLMVMIGIQISKIIDRRVGFDGTFHTPIVVSFRHCTDN